MAVHGVDGADEFVLRALATLPAEVINHVADAPLAATEVIARHRAGEGPSQPRACRHRRVDVLVRADSLIHEGRCFLEDDMLEAVGDVGFDFAAERERLLADGFVEGRSPGHDIIGRSAARDHLDKRHEVAGCEGMADDDPFRVPATRLETCRQEGR